LKKFFNTNTKADVGETSALAWQGRKAYLATYDKFKIEEKKGISQNNTDFGLNYSEGLD